jgi:hypothetical protein
MELLLDGDFMKFSTKKEPMEDKLEHDKGNTPQEGD